MLLLAGDKGCYRADLHPKAATNTSWESLCSCASSYRARSARKTLLWCYGGYHNQKSLTELFEGAYKCLLAVKVPLSPYHPRHPLHVQSHGTTTWSQKVNGPVSGFGSVGVPERQGPLYV